MNAESYDSSPKPQPLREIRDLLGVHLRNGAPCEIVYDHNGDVCTVECFVASVHVDFMIQGRIFQTSWINGWTALRLNSIIRVNLTNDAGFILRAMMANGTPVPLLPPVDFDTFQEFLNGVCDTFKIITTDDDPSLTHPSAAGTILEVNLESITIRAMSTQGFWNSEPHTIDLKHITHVVFGGKYERTLQRIAELPDT